MHVAVCRLICQMVKLSNFTNRIFQKYIPQWRAMPSLIYEAFHLVNKVNIFIFHERWYEYRFYTFLPGISVAFCFSN